MRLYVDIDPDTYEDMKALVVEGRYESVDQFLRAAADNQLSLERSDPGEHDTAHAPAQSTAESTGAHTTDTSMAATERSAEATPTRYEWGYDPPSAPPTRESAPASRGETLLFSQYYRFVPLKFALVELARATDTAGGPVRLAGFRDHVREIVMPLREALAAWEADADVKKQERFSTGFPNPDSKNPERSMKRYLDHYVGHFRSEVGDPEGLGHHLGLVSIQATDDEPTIALSTAGVSFISLENPLLAKGPTHERSTLSDHERKYLVAHLRRTLPLEYDFVTYVYKILDYHVGTYTAHMERFRMFLEWAPGFTDDPGDNRVRSHTAGTISRMVDLGLLERGRRRGEYVTVCPPEAFRYPMQLRDEDEDNQTTTTDHQ
jgi:Arc/MetJ-type ribon-helix-helix transcriptional regulator